MVITDSDNEANDLPSTSSEVADIAEKVVVDLVPQKSRQQYELVYNKFKQWCVSKSVNILSILHSLLEGNQYKNLRKMKLLFEMNFCKKQPVMPRFTMPSLYLLHPVPDHCSNCKISVDVHYFLG
jgi:hypothetical protein